MGVRTLPLSHEGPARPTHRRRRSRRRFRAVLIALALLLVARVVLDPNRPWMKREVQAYVLSKTGFEVDYGWIHVDLLSGMQVDDFVVRTPPDLRPIAPDLLRASRLDVRWSRSSLFGDGPRVERIALSEVTVAVVVDEHGRTSLDAILPPGGPPLSHRAGQLLAPVPIAERLDVTRADVELLWARESRVAYRERIHGVSTVLTATPNEGRWRVRADAGSSAEPLDIQLSQQGDGSSPREARGDLSLATVLTASTLDVALDLNLREQSFGPEVELGKWHADASARFDPDAGRTTVAVDRVTSPTGAVTVAASIDVPDSGSPFLRHAHGNVTVEHVRPWIPTGLLPITAESGELHFDIASAILESPPRLSEQGFVRVDSNLTNVQIQTPASTIDIERTHGVLEARPTNAPGFALQGWQELDAATFDVAGVRARARDLAIDVDGSRRDNGSLTGLLDFRVGEIERRGGRVAAIARDAQCHVRVDELLPGSARAIDATASGVLQISDRGHRLVAAPAHARLDIRDVVLDAAPIASRGKVRGSIDVGRNSVFLDAVKRADSVDYSLRAVLPDLQAIGPFLSPAHADGIDLRSSGRIDRIASAAPRIRHDTSLEIARPTLANVSARSLSLALHSEGTTSRHQADAKLRASGLVIDGTPASDDALALSTSWDRDRRSFQLNALAGGRVEALLEVSATFDDDARAVAYDASGRLAGFSGLAPLAARVHALRGLDLSRLELAASAHGTLFGVVSAVAPNGKVELERDPWRTAAIEGAADVRVANVRWNRGGVALGVPAAVWHGDMHADRTIAMHSDIASLRLGLGRHQIDFAGISDDTTATVTGDLLDPTVDLAEHATIRAVEQDFVLVYPKTDGAIALSLRREPDGLLRISDLHLKTSAGTIVDLRGGIDLGTRRNRMLSVSADVTQDLQPLSLFPKRFSGSGTVEVTAILESSDLSSYRTRLDVTASNVAVRLPGIGIEAQAVDAAIPIHMDFDVENDVARVRRDAKSAHDRYALHRFQDQLPLSRRPGFLSVGRLRVPHLEIAPFVGNLAIEQTTVLLGQFEMGVRGGWLSGYGALDWNRTSSNIEAHVRAAGVQSSHGEPFDANMAIVLSVNDESIEGRLEIARMGKRHLLDVFDVADPLHVDPAMNSVRRALVFGYPSRLHVGFRPGFANARVELGGLARFATIEEIRDVPTGLLIDRLIKAVLEEKQRTP